MSRYFYNGVELPALPEYDKEAYPYAVIGQYTTTDGYITYFFFARNTPFLVKGDAIPMPLSVPVKYKTPADQTDVWETAGSSAYATKYVWSNHDVYSTEDSTVLVYEASDPVPVEPEEPVPTYTARDLYKVINGKPTKLTLYKKLGGKLVALDEHTKEVKT